MYEEKQFQSLCRVCPEIMLYFTINTLGGFIWRMNHDMADYRIPAEDHPAVDKDVRKAQEQIQFAVDHTTRFGISQPRGADGKATPEYWAWFQRWDGYVNSLSEEQFAELNEALTAYTEALAEVEKWQPKAVEQES